MTSFFEKNGKRWYRTGMLPLSQYWAGLLLLLPFMAMGEGDLRRSILEQVDSEFADLVKIYEHLHANPELSHQEVKTAALLAAELRAAGFETQEDFGGNGVVGVLRNGEGPVVLLRADMDALPVEEKTGLAYASQARGKNPFGDEVPIMHACGHDLHMTVLIGSARVLAYHRVSWQGTLILIGQPAEEVGQGAKEMLGAGLFKEYPAPDYAFALHVSASLPAGKVGYAPGFAMANVDSADIFVKGVGGHGAYPHSTKDPIVLSAQIILALQTIASRESSPLEPVVVTVGSVHGGTKHNIIPNQVHLQLTIRTYSDESRSKTLAAIRRIAEGQAIAAGLPGNLYPEVTLKDEYTPSLYNDPILARRLAKTLSGWLGSMNIVNSDPVMGGEDFGRYGRTPDKIPICLFWFGGVNPEVWENSLKTGETLPSLHSPYFAPAPDPAIKTGVTGMVAVVLELAGSAK